MVDGVRTRNIFDPSSKDSFTISRSKLQLFLDCPRCFYLDRRCGIGRIDSMAYTLNIAVDILLKREFDRYRAEGMMHPVMRTYGIEALPHRDPRLDDWRDTNRGIRVPHRSGFELFGAVDDVWIGDDKKLIVVDYKATSTEKTVMVGDRDSYKRQLEVYQWLLRSIGEQVSDRGYFVIANADRSPMEFNAKLSFQLSVVSYDGNGDWIDDALDAAAECLKGDTPPPSTNDCEWCAYRKAARQREAI